MGEDPLVLSSGVGGEWREKAIFVITGDLYENYRGYVHKHVRGTADHLNIFGGRLREVPIQAKSGRQKVIEVRKQGYLLPSLDDAREAWVEAHGAIEWD